MFDYVLVYTLPITPSHAFSLKMGWVHNASPEVEAASQYPLILGVCLGLTILMVFTVSLRLFLRARASRWAAADYVMVVSMVS